MPSPYPKFVGTKAKPSPHLRQRRILISRSQHARAQFRLRQNDKRGDGSAVSLPKICRDKGQAVSSFLDRTRDINSGATGIDLIWWLGTDI